MSALETELDETNTDSVAPGPQARVTVKLEPAGDNQKKQGFRHVFHEHPGGARIAALLLLAVVIVAAGLFLRNSLAWESTDDAQVNGHIMPLSARINGYVLEVPTSLTALISVTCVGVSSSLAPWMASQSAPMCDPARPARPSSWEVRSGVRLG
jgi:hypothetical protein